MDEKCNNYERAGFATYEIVHREETGGSGVQKIVVEPAEPFDRQGVEDMVKSVRESTELWECPPREGNPCLHGFYNRHVFRVSKVVDCGVLRAFDLTA